jgi:hypothetical protein
VDSPGTEDDQGKHRVDGGQLDHRAEGLIIVDAGPLGEAVKDPMSLITCSSHQVELVLDDPFVGDDVGANRMRDKILSVAGDQSIIFFFHGTTLGRVNEGSMDGGGHRRERR